jgi:hypothetical protein
MLLLLLLALCRLVDPHRSKASLTTTLLLLYWCWYWYWCCLWAPRSRAVVVRRVGPLPQSPPVEPMDRYRYRFDHKTRSIISAQDRPP